MGSGLARIWIVALGFALGCVWGEGTASWPFVVALAAGATLLSIRRRSVARIPALLAVAVGLGALAASVRSPFDAAIAEMASSVPQCDVRGTVLEHAGGLGTLVAVDRATCTGYGSVEHPGPVWIDDRIGYSGSPIRARGWLLPLSDEGFDSARRRAGGPAALDVTELEVTRPPVGPAGVAAAVRDGLARSTQDLGGESGALLRGLTIGDTEGLGAATVDRFRRSGLSHLVAVSGTNVAIVLGSILVLASRLPHKLRLVLSGLGLALFVLIVGPEPSVLRAAAMGGIGLCALAWGRRAEPLHALGIALLVVLAFRPGMVFSVGLQLSVAATAGIVLWTTRLAHALRALPRVAALGLGATVAAQLAVAPLLVGTFGQLSLASPVANLMAMPAVAPATILGLAAGVVGTLSEAAGSAVARVAEPFSAWILLVGNSVGDLEWSSVALPKWGALVIAVPVMIAVGVALRDDDRLRLQPPPQRPTA